MKLEHSQITRVQQANDIIDVISEHVKLTRKGREMTGLCPFHDDHKPSLNVSADKQIFKCYACSAGGDVIKFIQMREGLTFMRAVERLAERAGIKLDFARAKGANEPSGIDAADVEKVNRWAMKFWRKNLLDSEIGEKCREYVKSRHLTDATSEEYGFGYALDRWDDFLSAARKRNIPDKLMLAAGLIVSNEQGKNYDKFRNRLMIPIIDAASRVVGFGGRTLGDDPAKYMNSPTSVIFDKSNCVYGLDKARHEIVTSGMVAVVEGYTDVIMTHQAGCKNVVATLGTSFTAGHAKLLRRYAKNIVLIFDSDVAGAAASERALEICLAESIDIKVTSVPQGKDPCDFVYAAGGEAFKNLMVNATDVMKYRWDRLTDKFGKSENISDRKAATEEFLRSVAMASKGGTLDAITFGLIVNRISKTLEIPADDIRKELGRRGQSRQAIVNTVENSMVSSRELAGFGAKAQEEIIETILNEPRLFESAAKKVKVGDFDVPLLREAWSIIEQSIAENVEFSLAGMLAKTESQDLAGLLVRLSGNGQDMDTLRRRFNGALDALMEYKRKQDSNYTKTKDDDILQRISSIKARPDRRNPGMLTT
ncbi:MAG: DNA primase [Planctomycetes bacterium GWF2_42_9]|nr:MAG: DNA primase [Planctomycetes bacterium GWF2_42_9]